MHTSTESTPGAPYSSRKLDVLLHDRNSLCMNSAQIRIFKQVYHESLATLLQRLDRLRLPAESLAVYGDHREGYLADLKSD